MRRVKGASRWDTAHRLAPKVRNREGVQPRANLRKILVSGSERSGVEIAANGVSEGHLHLGQAEAAGSLMDARGMRILEDGCRSSGHSRQENQPSLVVFSGGTAFNSVASHLKNFTTRVSHVLPVSDDGGSTAEIVRVLGGPAVGDIRSRCLRLADDSDDEARAVKALLAHRLCSDDPEAAKRLAGFFPLSDQTPTAVSCIVRRIVRQWCKGRTGPYKVIGNSSLDWSPP